MMVRQMRQMQVRQVRMGQMVGHVAQHDVLGMLQLMHDLLDLLRRREASFGRRCRFVGPWDANGLRER